jgi:WXXGXW repeat (2 copies)
MRRFSLLAVSAALLLSSGCVVRARGHVRPSVVVVDPEPVGVVVINDPPPVRYVEVQPRRGYLFVQGRWDWRGNQWVWIDGHWERERPNYAYRPGRWQRHPRRGHVWIEGNWVIRGR